MRFAETPLDRENKLFVGMLPKTFSEQELQQMFQPFGDLKEVHIIRGPEGSPKGCAFVKFINKEAAIMAIDSLNETIPQVNSADCFCSERQPNCLFSVGIDEAFGGEVR